MKNILVFLLDRNPVQGNFLKYRLNSAGINNVKLFQTPEECIYSLHKIKIPEFIIADAAFKSTTDMEFLRLIKSMDPSVKIIFHSDNEDYSHITELLEMGATDYIVRVEGNPGWIEELTSNLHYLIREEFRTR